MAGLQLQRELQRLLGISASHISRLTTPGAPVDMGHPFFGGADSQHTH